MAENSDLENFIVKGCMAIIVFVIGISFGSLPLLTSKVSDNLRDRVLGVCNSFAAGIFLAAGFIHLLSEGIDLFLELYPEIEIVNLALVFAPLGFVVTFFIDKVIFLKDELDIHEHEIPKAKRISDSDSDDNDKEHVHFVDKENAAHGHAHGMELSHEGKPTLANYILVIVLSFHSILAGILFFLFYYENL